MNKFLIGLILSVSFIVACETPESELEVSPETVETQTVEIQTDDAVILDAGEHDVVLPVSEPESTAPYRDCSSHDDCSEGQFCGVECWTGDCGDNEDVEAFTRGQYCQPCGECQFPSDSITNDCSVCD